MGAYLNGIAAGAEACLTNRYNRVAEISDEALAVIRCSRDITGALTECLTPPSPTEPICDESACDAISSAYPSCFDGISDKASDEVDSLMKAIGMGISLCGPPH